MTRDRLAEQILFNMVRASEVWRQWTAAALAHQAYAIADAMIKYRQNETDNQRNKAGDTTQGT